MFPSGSPKFTIYWGGGGGDASGYGWGSCPERPESEDVHQTSRKVRSDSEDVSEIPYNRHSDSEGATSCHARQDAEDWLKELGEYYYCRIVGQ